MLSVHIPCSVSELWAFETRSWSNLWEGFSSGKLHFRNLSAVIRIRPRGQESFSPTSKAFTTTERHAAALANIVWRLDARKNVKKAFSTLEKVR